MAFSKELKIGLFVLIVLLGTFIVINILRGTDILGREIVLVGHFDDVETLVVSAPVQLRGYAAGSVKEVVFDKESNDFKVSCSVSKEFDIPKDSRMVIYSTSIMGGKGIRIELGSSSDLAKDGDVLETSSQMDFISSLTSAASPLMKKVSSLMDSLQVTISNVNDVFDDNNKDNIKSSIAHLNRTLASAEKLSRTIGGKSAEIDSLISNLSSLSYKLSPVVASVQATVDNATSITGKLDEADIKGSVENINEAVVSITDAVNKIKTPLDSLLKDADSLIEKISENPRKYVRITLF